VDRLLELGSNVTVVDNLSFGKKENVNEGASFKLVDVRDYETLKAVMSETRPDIVYHLAATATTKESAMGWHDPVVDYQVNAVGTLNVLRSVVDVGLSSYVIHTSSAAVYGEPKYIPIDENHPMNPISPYAINKLTGEKYAYAYFREQGVPTIILRLFNAYGPRQPRYVMFDLLKKLKQNPYEMEVLGTGKQIRDYCYISDVVDAFILLVEKNAIGEAFNVGSGYPTSITELVKRMLKILNLEGKTKIRYTGKSWKGDITRWVANISKIRKLGFKPKVSLSDGILRLKEWFEQTEFSV